jgi:hypothetical protein
VSYKLSPDALRELLDKLNGLYVHGDSQKSIVHGQYQETFANVMDYVKTKNTEEGISFPLFLMGNSLNTFLKYKIPGNRIITKPMKELTFSNINLRQLKSASETYILEGQT